MTYEEFMSGSGEDTSRKDALQQLLEEKKQRQEQDRIARIKQYELQARAEELGPNPEQTVTPERQLNLARDFYSGANKVPGAYSPSTDFVAANKVVLPSDNTIEAKQKVEPTSPEKIETKPFDQVQTAKDLYGRYQSFKEKRKDSIEGRVLGITQSPVANEIQTGVEFAFDEILNLPFIKKAAQYTAKKTGQVGPALDALIRSASKDKTYAQAWNDVQAAIDNPNKNMWQKVGYAIETSGPQTLIGVALGRLSPKLASTYFGAVSAGSQANNGEDISFRETAIDTIGDRVLGDSIGKIFKSGQIKSIIRSIGEGGLTEGGTEVAQTLLKYSNDYSTGNKQDREKAVADAKNYILSGDMGVEFLAGGVTGGLIKGAAQVPQNMRAKEIARIKNETVNIPVQNKGIPYRPQVEIQETSGTAKKPEEKTKFTEGLKQLAQEKELTYKVKKIKELNEDTGKNETLFAVVDSNGQTYDAFEERVYAEQFLKENFGDKVKDIRKAVEKPQKVKEPVVETIKQEPVVESEVSKGLNEIKEARVKKVERAQQVLALEIKERLAKEKLDYQSREQGGAVTEEDIIPTKEEEPVAPNFATASGYEIGEYYRAKEKWDNKQKTVKQQTPIKKETKANKLFEKYNKLQQSEEPTDGDFVKMMKIEDSYRKLTGKDIGSHEEVNMNNASYNRTVDEAEYEDALYSKRKGTSKIQDAAIRNVNNLDQEIQDIETGRKKFSVPAEALKVVRKYGLKLVKSIKGTEGHAFSNIIGHDSINNVLLLAHEMTHIFTLRAGELQVINKTAPLMEEVVRMYRKYYPGGAKSVKTVGRQVVLKEGVAEFVRQHLFNPTKISKDFPNLTAQFLRGGRLSIKNVVDMYDDLNKILYIYQNLSTDKQMTAMTALDVPFEKEGIISPLIGRAGRIKAEGQDSLYPLHALDLRTNRIDGLDKSKPFILGTRGVSSEQMASMIRPGQQVALANLDKSNKDSKILTPEGNIEQFLDFNIGQFIAEVESNGDTEGANNYFRALADRRERIKLNKNKLEFVSLMDQLPNIEDKKERKITEAKIKRAKENIVRLTEVISKQTHSAEKQDQVIKSGEQKYAKYADRMYQIFNAHLNLMVKDGRVSQKTADDWRSIPGYIPGFRLILSDVDESGTRLNEKSSSAKELKAKKGSIKPLLNIFTVIPKLHVETLSKHNAQVLSNNVYEQLKPLALVSDLGEGTMNKLGVGVYAKDGKMIQYKILDPYVAKTMESLYSRANINNKILKGLDATFHSTARVFQKFTTQLNFYFALFKNFFLDTFTAPVLSETGYIPLYSQAKIQLQKLRGGEQARDIAKYDEEYERLSGGDSGIYEMSYDSENPLEVIDRITEKQSKFKQVTRFLGQKYTRALGTTETFTRQTEYVRARQQGDTVAMAYEKSRNVSGSWHKSGLTAKHLIKYAPFTNSGIQIGTQLITAMRDKRNAKKLGIMFAAASIIQFASILDKIRRLDDADDEESRQEALDNIYRYLDKSTYEKFNYAPLGDKYKMAISPIFSAPGTLIGLLMLSNRIPEYKVNFADAGYQVIQGFLPSQLSFELGSGEEFFKSVFGRLIGSFPLTNTAAALAGYKTYPGIEAIENRGMLDDAVADRYKADTNNLALLLGRMTGISPVNLEAAIRASLGTGGGYATDLVGSILLPDAKKEELGVIDKDLKILLFTSPTKSAISQTQKTLTGETAEKIYNYGDGLKSSVVRLENRLDEIERMYPYDGNESAPKDVALEYNSTIKEVDTLKEEMKVAKKVQQTLSVLKKYETMDKYYPVDLKNILNQYMLAVDSGKGGISGKDLDRIIEMSGEYNDMKNINWSELKDK